MGKLAPARVSYRDDFVISYHVYMITGSFHAMFTWKLNQNRKHGVHRHWEKLRMRYPFQCTCKPISHWNEWSFRVYMIPLRNLVPEWNSRPGARTGVNSRRGDSRGHDILWWYHVNKCRAMRGNRSELALGSISAALSVPRTPPRRDGWTRDQPIVSVTLNLIY